MPLNPVPVAWLGRTSTEDAQDPTLSLPRQLRNARAALPPGWVIVAHFYDVESGRKDLDARGRSRAHERFAVPIPRDGGIADLLSEAHSPGRRFAAVICESIERVARRTYFGTKIEYELEQSGVVLCAADEPILTDRRAKRATPTLTRRVKQAVAEWYVLQMLELSWDGFVEHTQQGWNVGKPPYGYLAERVPHPVPVKREQGLCKHRLRPDPLRGPVVAEIFRLRVLRRLSYARIADELNADPAGYPPPEPTRGGAAKGRWTASSVRTVLDNPKYTGYQVWNRRARKKNGNRSNPVSEWVWSPAPTHEPLVSRQLFDAAWPSEAAHSAVRKERAARDTVQRFYVLRSYLLCVLCGHRMHGKESKGRTYYSCQPKRQQSQDADWYASHARAIWIGERPLLEAVHDFFENRVFGPDRHALLAADLAAAASAPEPDAGREDEIERLRRRAEALDRRKERLLDRITSADEDGDDPQTAAEFRKGLRKRFDATEHERQDVLARIDAYREETVPDDAGDPSLLEAVPQLSVRFSRLPDALKREIFDAFRLRVHYDGRDRTVRLEVTVVAAVAAGLAKIATRAATAVGAADQPLWKCPRQDSNLRPSA
ncbi:recombinase family protein [Streptomyces sp. SL13]|uniref:Recombinase family protein n=2 Tax=Streptantibioticus silvisoli TaxID=2705255 RepID=A0AA90KBH9_9ACTN|nr:recombinase family protein [Streptantibioticus silvisoli]